MSVWLIEFFKLNKSKTGRINRGSPWSKIFAKLTVFPAGMMAQQKTRLDWKPSPAVFTQCRDGRKVGNSSLGLGVFSTSVVIGAQFLSAFLLWFTFVS